jgi:DNA-binding NtrC family response regulator
MSCRAPKSPAIPAPGSGDEIPACEPISSLPISVTRPEAAHVAVAVGLAPEFPSDGLSLEDNERQLLAKALEKTSGNQTQAARLLRITRDTLRYKMKKFNLK